jgi:hypothetical protein
MEYFVTTRHLIKFRENEMMIRSGLVEKGLYLVYSEDPNFKIYIGSKGFLWDMSNKHRFDSVVWASPHEPYEEIKDFVLCLISSNVLPVGSEI